MIARDALGDLIKLGQGGQGVVYRAPKITTKFADSMVFKEYKPPTRAAVSFEALSAMPALVEKTLPDSEGKKLVSIAAWPCALVETSVGPVGFVMPSIPDDFFIPLTTVKGVSRSPAEFQHLLNPSSVLAARGITITDAQRYQLLLEVAKALAFLHKIGVCVGDISPKNLLFSLRPRPTVYFVDCDAMRIDGVSALPQAETPEWQVPKGEELATVESDTYKLGLLALRLLVGDQNTRDVQRLPSTTPKFLRQLIVDTLVNEPELRPLPEAWTYLLGHVVDQTQPRKSTPEKASAATPAPRAHAPEPPPVVRSRPTTMPGDKHVASKVGTPTRAASAKSPAALTPTKAWAIVVGTVAGGLLLAGLIVVAITSSGGSSQSTRKTTATPSASTTTRSWSTTSTTPVMGAVERAVRNAEVGDCYRMTSDVQPNGESNVVELLLWGCGNSGSDIRVVRTYSYRTGDSIPCPSDEGWIRSGGQDPRVVLCYVSD